MDDRRKRRINEQGWTRPDIHISSRNPILFVILLLAFILVSVYIDGVAEGWWN